MKKSVCNFLTYSKPKKYLKSWYEHYTKSFRVLFFSSPRSFSAEVISNMVLSKYNSCNLRPIYCRSDLLLSLLQGCFSLSVWQHSASAFALVLSLSEKRLILEYIYNLRLCLRVSSTHVVYFQHPLPSPQWYDKRQKIHASSLVSLALSSKLK